MAAGRPLSFKTVEELEEKIDEYFKSDEAHLITYNDGEENKTFAPTVSGLSMFLKCDRKTLINYGRKEEYFHTIKNAKARIESHLEKRLYGNNVTGTIFNLKNNFDWKDKSEVEQTNVELTHEQWLESLE